ncbi:hypothetical protein E0K83_03875 [Gramella sp. BOM4]|nr:hypothetical protein [Christiangramia bathymodioli]
MIYPQKVAFTDKQNRRPVTDPEGQLSALEANDIRNKLNANALFYDVHDDLAALQAAFPNPPKGAFAYLLDGSCYRCVSLGWTTDPTSPGGGSGETYFKGYYIEGSGQTALQKLQAAYPDGQPGWRAILRVAGGNDKEAIWDEDDNTWFTFDFSSSIGQAYVDQKDAETLAASKAYAESLVGGNVSPTRIDSWVLGYDSGLTYNPVFNFTIDGVSKVDSRQIILEAQTAANGGDVNPRRDVLCINKQTEQIEAITGTPSENLDEPDIDFSIYLKGPIIDIPAGGAAPSNVEITSLYDENLGVAGGEADFYGNAAYDPDNLENPASGNKAIKVVGELVVNQLLSLTLGADLPIAKAKELQLQLQNITSGGNFHITVIGKRSNGRTDSFQIAAPSGFDPANTANYQSITLPVSTNQLVSITSVRFVTQVAGYKFYLDKVRFVGGEGTSGGSDNNYVTKEQFDAKNAEQDQRLDDLENSEGSNELVIVVSSSRDFLDTDHGKILMVTAAVTLNMPDSGIREHFSCDLDCLATGQATITKSSAVAFDFPNGQILKADKMATIYRKGTVNEYRGKGEFSI